jgi:LuxR family maltose regulon positive regulatory protein
LYRPRLPKDLVSRKRLIKKLEQGHKRSLTLVSAPAGYGKSVLLSDWLERTDYRSAWLSLDEGDSDLLQFLHYFLAALRSVFPDIANETKALLNAPKLPPTAVLSATLLNELDQIEEPIILVLDDFHHVSGNAVNDFLSAWLRHPPSHVHLVLASRRDPGLPIDRLRGRGEINEIRVAELCFRSPETALFLASAIQGDTTPDMAEALTDATEGWITAMRLLLLSIQHTGNPEIGLSKIRKSDQYVAGFLVSEVLQKQAPLVGRYLLNTSVLDRFCAPLCDVMVGAAQKTDNTAIKGKQFIAQLEASNSFIVSLDTQGKWYRYHHLFRDLLLKELRGKNGKAAVDDLHMVASRWFEAEGLIEEAIRHALRAGQLKDAASIVERHRYDEQNSDRWRAIEKWHSLIDKKMVWQRPNLLLTQAWILHDRFEIAEIAPLVNQIECTIEENKVDSLMLGELKFFRGVLSFWQGNIDESRSYFAEARSLIPEQQSRMTGLLEIYWGLIEHYQGQHDRALQELERRITSGHSRTPALISRLYLARSFIHLLSGEFAKVVQNGVFVQTTAEPDDLNYVIGWGHYMQAMGMFSQYKLEMALEHLLLTQKNRYVMHTRSAVDAMAALALAHQECGKPVEANTAMAQLLQFADETTDPNHINVARSAKARLDLAQGNLESALEWLHSFEGIASVPQMFMWLEVPVLTKVRVLIVQGSDEGLSEAAEILDEIYPAIQKIRNDRQLIEILVLQTLILDKQRRKDEAISLLKQVITLAGPNNWVWPFIEAGRRMHSLLLQLGSEGFDNGLLANLLQAFANSHMRSRAGSIPQPGSDAIELLRVAESLTNRELDVLELLGQRLQNKQIASRLSVSPETIKTHLKCLYQKLDVHNRRQAVIKSEKLSPYLSEFRISSSPSETNLSS